MIRKLADAFSQFIRRLDTALINAAVLVIVLLLGAYGFLSLKRPDIATICIILMGGIIVLNIVLRVFKKRKMARIAKGLGIATKQGTVFGGLVGKFNLPLFVVRDDGRAIWANDAFEELYNENPEKCEEYMTKLFKEYQEEYSEYKQKEGADRAFVYKKKIGNSTYNVYCNLVSAKNLCASGYAYAMYLVDITGTVRLTELYKQRRLAVGEIVIDNYDEIFQMNGEAVMNQVQVELSKLFDEWLKDRHAIVKRLVRERYIFLIEKRHLDVIKNEKFDLLEKVKKISKGNTIPVTISIGISDNCDEQVDDAAFAAFCDGDDENPNVQKAFGDSLPEHFNRAEELIKLALGRGGDQVILQEGDNSQFFGGSEIDIERGNKVKARVIANILRKEILGCSRVLVMGHANADLDALGAALGMYRIAETLGKEAYVILEGPNSQISVMYEHLMKDGNYDNVFIKKNEALNILDDNTFVILVDTFSARQSEAPEVIENAPRLAVVDHHRRGVDYLKDTVFTYTETGASSTSELVIEIMRYISPKLTLPKLEAETLYGGILVDTKNLYFKTGKRTFEVTSFLRGMGVNPISVRKYVQPDMESFKKVNDILSGMHMVQIKSADGGKQGIAFARCDISPDEANTVAPIAADKMLEIAGVDASFVLIQLDGGVSVKARSLGEVNVQIILENNEIRGGGHLTAAGGFAKGKNVQEVIRVLSDIMGFDAKQLSSLY